MECDLLIVGGGYAGLAAGIEGARHGAKTIVLERYDSVGKISRCGGGTFESEVSMYFDISDISQRIKQVAFISSNSKCVRTVPEIGLVVLDTVAFLKKLETVARKNGVEILCSHDVRHILKEGKRVCGVEAKTKSNNVKFRAPLTIDCSGVARAVVGKCKSRLENSQKAFGIEVEFDRQEDPEYGELIVGDKDAPTGYAWIFPCPHGRTRVGVGFIDSKYWRLADSYLEHVIETRLGTIKKANQVLRRGGFVPCHYPIANPLCDSNGYAYAGDAAGHISLLTGEGTRFALKWGGLIGKACAQIASGEREMAIQEFTPLWKDYRISLIGQYWMNRLMAGLSNSQWDWAVSKLTEISNTNLAGLLKGTISMGEVLRRVRRHIFKF